MHLTLLSLFIYSLFFIHIVLYSINDAQTLVSPSVVCHLGKNIPQTLTCLTVFVTTYSAGTSRLIGQRLLHAGGKADAEEVEEEVQGGGDGGRRAAQQDAVELSRLEHQQRAEALEQQLQMKILEWENRMKVLAWEQELVKERRRAARQKEKAFKMKKAYYKAKLKRMGEDVPLSSSSSDEDDKTSDPTG